MQHATSHAKLHEAFNAKLYFAIQLSASINISLLALIVYFACSILSARLIWLFGTLLCWYQSYALFAAHTNTHTCAHTQEYSWSLAMNQLKAAGQRLHSWSSKLNCFYCYSGPHTHTHIQARVHTYNMLINVVHTYTGQWAHTHIYTHRGHWQHGGMSEST